MPSQHKRHAISFRPAEGDHLWLARHAASVAVYNGGIWITGGTTDENGSQNDVWKLDKGPIVPIINSQLLLN